MLVGRRRGGGPTFHGYRAGPIHFWSVRRDCERSIGSSHSGVMISVKNLGTSVTRTALADETGSYTVVNLEPGDYEITMEQPGFQKVTRANLQLFARQTVRVDGVMQLLSQAQTVEVSVEAVAPIATEVSNIAETKLGRELIE